MIATAKGQRRRRSEERWDIYAEEADESWQTDAVLVVNLGNEQILQPLCRAQIAALISQLANVLVLRDAHAAEQNETDREGAAQQAGRPS